MTTLVSDTETSSDQEDLVEKIYEKIKEDQQLRQHFPGATYRFQFNRFFTFDQAQAQINYLKRLGITDLYASPYFKARAESMHGYDICDHNTLNPSIGNQKDYDQMVNELHRHDLYQILDIVPNHMGIGEPCNTWWMDVLENGPSSLFATYFDIDWNPLKAELKDKVLLPTLGDMYGKVLENKELQLSFDASTANFYLHYYENTLPINPRSYLLILEYRQEELFEKLGADSRSGLEYASIITALHHLPTRSETKTQKVLERNREKEIIKQRLAVLWSQEPAVQTFIEQNVEIFNGVAGEPHSFDLLDKLLEEQAYRLSYWRVSAEEINYRRFFDVDDLAAIRVDEPVVFEETHRTIFKLVGDGKLNGVRVDHIDGLRNPKAYLQHLQERYFVEFARRQLAEMPLDAEAGGNLEARLLARFQQDQASGKPQMPPLFVAVEKILGRSEDLPADWPVDGTTGYEFANAVNSLFVDSANQKAFDQIYNGFIGEKVKFADLAYQKKKQIMWVSLASEVNVLTNLLHQVSERNRRYRDFTLNSLRNAIREVIACFPVYRTYITRDESKVNKQDLNHIDTAISRAKKRNPSIEPSVFDFLREVLTLNFPDDLDEAGRTDWYNFVMKFQQCSGPVIAKGLEDTAFYIYNRLISLNEVGGEPDQFGISLSNFNRQQADRLRNWPYSLLTTSTHDTKRSEDVRARLNVLSEIPQEWKKALSRWARFNRRKKTVLDGQRVPSANEEYLLYQTLLGIWPFESAEASPQVDKELVGRVNTYMLKALKEAKVNTSWLTQNSDYEAAVAKFVEAILDQSDPKNRFLNDFRNLQKKIACYGMFNSLSQALIKFTSPGVPDIYQGNELWDFSLVDPDNRRPVDYDLRNWLLGEVEQINDVAGAANLLDTKEDGRIKLFVTSRALHFRQENTALFERGAYTPLEVSGPRQDNICAFVRSLDGKEALAVAPRFMTRLATKPGEPGPVVGAVWQDSWLVLPGATGDEKYRNIFTGEIVKVTSQDGKPALALSEVLAAFPVALLEKISD